MAIKRHENRNIIIIINTYLLVLKEIVCFVALRPVVTQDEAEGNNGSQGATIHTVLPRCQ